ncbi:MAG: hypothetical protein C4522_08975 [Desulfobacteraceae bacterium]|nr:MAG: hypothetical protein C4522_08975 [Desulfobacteraceae bacterium]
MTTDEHINDILKTMRKSIKPSTGPLTSIDLKKLAKASKDVQIAKEIAELIKQESDDDKGSEKKKP